ncbi:hypothetical protein I4U23_005585 [Adineta vaga]|nr:hypothetical protein I4U23_005585 [Adineta vaga]
MSSTSNNDNDAIEHPQSIYSAWSDSLKPAIEKLLNGFSDGLIFEELFRITYAMVLGNHGEKLYQNTQQLIHKHLVEKVRPKLIELPLAEFLALLKLEWDKYNKSIIMIRDILGYMNRIYVPVKNLESITDLGLRLFRDDIILFSTRQRCFMYALLEVIANKRRGELIDGTTIQEMSHFFTKFNVQEYNLCNEEFETLYLQHLKEFYQSEIEKLLIENIALEYINKIIIFINEEIQHVIFYFDQSIEQHFTQLLIDEFITKHKTRLMKMEKSRIYPMFELNQYD